MKTALAVIAGYMTMVIIAATIRFGAYLFLGVDGAFRPGSYLPSNTWIASNLVFALVAAVVGGYVCAVISRDAGGPNLLAAAVLALGLVVGGFTLWERVAEPSPVRPPQVEISEAMLHAQQPVWVAFLHPFVGVAGILGGCRLRRRSVPSVST